MRSATQTACGGDAARGGGDTAKAAGVRRERAEAEQGDDPRLPAAQLPLQAAELGRKSRRDTCRGGGERAIPTPFVGRSGKFEARSSGVRC